APVITTATPTAKPNASATPTHASPPSSSVVGAVPSESSNEQPSGSSARLKVEIDEDLNVATLVLEAANSANKIRCSPRTRFIRPWGALKDGALFTRDGAVYRGPSISARARFKESELGKYWEPDSEWICSAAATRSEASAGLPGTPKEAFSATVKDVSIK